MINSIGTWNWVLYDKYNSGQYTGINFYANNYSGSSPLLTSTVTTTANIWQYVTITRKGSTFTLYINGVSVSTETFAGAIDTGTPNGFQIGMGSAAAYVMKRYIEDFQFTKGLCKYSANFTPPIAEII